VARILVVGGSLGGLMAANLLLRAGHDVLVLERSTTSLQGRGAGIVTHAGLRQALVDAGVLVDDKLGVLVASRVVLGVDGQAVCKWAHPQILTSWGRLYALLCDALPCANHRLAAHVVGVGQDADGVRAQLASGETLQADLLIAADGIRSTVRAQLLPQVQVQGQAQAQALAEYAGYVAWRGVCDEALLSQYTLTSLFPHFGFGLPPGEQLIGYPVAGADHSIATGHRRWNYVWYRPAAAGTELDALLTDADGRHHPQGIAPQQVSWRHIAAMRTAARELLAPQFAEVIEKTALPFFQPIYDLASTAMAHGRIALMGDAAFVARPHVGMGVAKAADDAVALVHCISRAGATTQALLDYDAERRPACDAVVDRARRLGAHLQAGSPVPQHISHLQHAQSVMHQTAIDPALFNTYPAQALAA
jgi:2-polyprenyl-6-methoxyphenol hydroxylase-like FAD-dependent oxidoreductase